MVIGAVQDRAGLFSPYTSRVCAAQLAATEVLSFCWTRDIVWKEDCTNLARGSDMGSLRTPVRTKQHHLETPQAHQQRMSSSILPAHVEGLVASDCPQHHAAPSTDTYGTTRPCWWLASS